MNTQKNKNTVALLWGAAAALFLALIFARALFPEMLWLTATIATLLVAVLGVLTVKNKTAAYGINSTVTVLLVASILGVLNFMVSRYPLKLDLTKNKLHTLSDQTVKVVKGLQKPVRASLFAKTQQRDQFRPLLDNFKSLNPKFEVEYVDPDREPTRSKQAGIKKYGTLLLTVGNRENRVEEPNEEKLTNALIKLLKEKSPALCAITGHGEKNFSAQDGEGYDVVRKALVDQSYEVKDLNILQETKIPESCDAIAIIGPTKAFFEPEIKAIRQYLEEGGRAIVSVDLNLKGPEYAPELLPVLESWYIKPGRALVVDPLSRMLGLDASVAILATFSKDNPITKDFQGNCHFPLLRPLEVMASAPAGMNVKWLAQTTPKSMAISDITTLSKGEIKFNPSKDRTGPLNAAIVVDGKQKDSKATKNTRMVVFGSSYFATNNFSRYGGNLDFFLNSISWVMEDESLISIRAKEEGPGKIELSQKAATFIFLLTFIVMPLAVAGSGLAIWLARRKL